MVYLGLDYGSTTIGLAISDRTSKIATPLQVIRYKSLEDGLIMLDNVLKERNIDALVLGNPLNLNGTVSKRSEESFKLKEILEKRYNIKVFMQDERLSTTEAHRMLISNDTRRKNRKKVVDKIAATIILQSFLDRMNNNER